MKSIMIIGGSARQQALIESCNRCNYKTIVVDGNPNAFAKDQASIFVNVDIFDVNQIIAEAQKYKVSAVISDQSDLAVPIVAIVSEKLGLESISYETALLFTDKYKMRERCTHLMVSQPKYSLCKQVEDARAFCLQHDFPVVIKPIDSSGSRGVTVINDMAELFEQFEATAAVSRKSEVIVEEYIDGPEFTVEGIKFDTQHTSIATSIKAHYKNAPMIANELMYSRESDEYDYDELRRINNGVVDGLGLKFGITHAEYKYSNGKFYLIEIAARGGGGRIASHILPRMLNVDLYNALVNRCLGNPVRIEYKNQKHAECYCLHFFERDEGKVKFIRGYELIKNHPKVLHSELNINIGDYINEPGADGDRIGGFIAYDEDITRLRKLINYFENALEVEYE